MIKLKNITGNVGNSTLDFGIFTEDAVEEALEALRKDYLSASFSVHDIEYNVVKTGSRTINVGSAYDYINRNDYLATKLWSEEDIASTLFAEGYPASEANLSRVINSGMLKYLEECTDGDWQIIKDAIKCSAVEEEKIADILNNNDILREERLLELAEPNQKIASFAIVGNYMLYNYVTYNCIMEDDSDNISACLEMTLHKLIESGATDETICGIMGAVKYNGETYADGYTDIDLGYVIPGLITNFKIK